MSGPTRRPSRSLRPTFIALVTGALAVACAPSSGSLGTVATPPPTTAPSIAAPSAEPTPIRTVAGSPEGSSGTGAMTTVRAYFYLGSFTGDSGLVPVLRSVPKTASIGTAAMLQLLLGPNATELGARPAMYTSISASARFLGLSVSNGVAIVDLSKEFETANDNATLDQRIAQVVYTLTQFPTVTSVAFELDGQPAPADFQSSYTRAGTVGQLASIAVDGPAWGGVLRNGGSVTGTANVFEATFRLEILDAAGQSLSNNAVMASCGTGCWGSFDAVVEFTIATPQWGALRVYDLSAKDGSREHQVDYPVWLTP
ncbi:MAG TPA: Gmad2 immunoglobulin-like domain-containing protein [Candidatus Limnocylindrales bacterium]|nr:Gmad2 immunoglobulin-like domain-containing protein [Candidatus Limnocylindrales bacterium]